MANAFHRLVGGETIAAKMIRHDNRARGFDYIRLALSLAVLVWHSFLLSTRVVADNATFGFAVKMILPMFFALSGFLISGSLMRTPRIYDFVMLRAIRIMPALAVEVLLSAFILGTAFTTLPLGDYFDSGLFGAYLLNLIGDIHFLLPGVFATNPITAVNLSLWTVPFELQCYLAIIVLWIAGAVPGRRWLLLAIVAAATVAVPVHDTLSHNLVDATRNVLPGRLFVLAFLWAIVLYAFRERIVLRGWIAALCVVACYFLFRSDYGSYLVGVPAAYLTVYLGLMNPPRAPVIMRGDYSYGVYLYAAPLQQAVVALFPAHRNGFFVLAVTLPVICLFAAFSWHAVELPILSRRKAILAGVDALAARLTRYARRPCRRLTR